jgi:SAM-dependent methyltransferase
VAVEGAQAPYYREDLALAHHLGFGFHADACAPGIVGLLDGVRRREGLVLELGCGSGLLTRHLIDAGCRVLATDASPAMLALARDHVPEAEDVRQLVLPDDPLPPADAVVSVGHALSYLPGEDAVHRALTAAARALRPGGVLALDLCGLEWAEAWGERSTRAWVRDDWAMVTTSWAPSPVRYVREITTFVRRGDGMWRRDDERHDNVLVDVSVVPGLFAEHGVIARTAPSFGTESLPRGLVAVIGSRPA